MIDVRFVLTVVGEILVLTPVILGAYRVLRVTQKEKLKLMESEQ